MSIQFLILTPGAGEFFVVQFASVLESFPIPTMFISGLLWHTLFEWAAEGLARVFRVFSQFLFNAQNLVVLGKTLATARRAGFDLQANRIWVINLNYVIEYGL